MPRPFSDHEKSLIQAALLEKGSAIFAAYGLRKTSIDDLASAAGISKGAFYLFYDSKESLYLDILARFEADYRRKMLGILSEPGHPPRQALGIMLQASIHEWKNNPLFQRFSKEEYALLLRKIPPENLAKMLGEDQDFSVILLDHLKKAGATLKTTPEQVANLMKVLFLISLHEDDFGPGALVDTLDLLIEMTLDQIF